MLLNELEIVNNTHTIKCFIPLGNVFQAFTGKLFTFITEFHFVVQKQLASFLEKRTLLVSRSATLTVSHSHALSSKALSVLPSTCQPLNSITKVNNLSTNKKT